MTTPTDNPPPGRRMLIQDDPFHHTGEPGVWGGVPWPAHWVELGDAPAPPFVSAYRCVVEIAAAQTVRIHVSADERYELFLDGRRLGRGPQRGDALHWRFETYDLDLTPGRRALVARVWSFGQNGHRAPGAQMSVRPGFLLAAEGPLSEQLSTGRGPWQAKRIEGHTCDPPGEFNAGHYAGGTERIDGRAYPWGVEQGNGDGWGPVRPTEAAQSRGFDYSHTQDRHVLTPAGLPPMLERPTRTGRVRFAGSLDPATDPTASHPVLEAEHDADRGRAWQALLGGGAGVQVPARACVRVLIDLDDYNCAYPDLVLTGGAGASVTLSWAESLYLHSEPNAHRDLKGHRDQVEGKFFHGRGDTFYPDGGPNRAFAPLWWRAGRYLELLIRTDDTPLTVDALSLRETRYPLTLDYQLETSDTALDAVGPLMARSLTTGMHETYMDCPYYEQLQYVGDTRLQCLVTYALSADDRLPRQALLASHSGRRHDGLTPSRYPCHAPQVIPGFALWWIGMVHDFMMWRNDPALIHALMPTVRSVIEAFEARRNTEGLVEAVPGWHFVDWVPGWEHGIPPPGPTGVSAILNWQYVGTLGQVTQLETFAGQTHLADRCRVTAGQIAQTLDAAFFDPARGLVADDATGQSFSEHAQALALLSGQLPENRQQRVLDGLLHAPDLARMTIYFSHYLFEVCHRFGLTEPIFQRLDALWLPLPALGVKTLLESPEPARSDNHGWGAHPLFHQFATLLGIRPASPGFGSVQITPQLGRLTHIHGQMPTPHGPLNARIRRHGDRIAGTLTLPQGLTGHLTAHGQTQTLTPGPNTIQP